MVVCILWRKFFVRLLIGLAFIVESSILSVRAEKSEFACREGLVSVARAFPAGFEDVLAKYVKRPEVLTLEWLHEHLLIGPEATFQDDDIDEIPVKYSIPTRRKEKATPESIVIDPKVTKFLPEQYSQISAALLEVPDYLNVKQARRIAEFVSDVLKPAAVHLITGPNGLTFIKDKTGKMFQFHGKERVFTFIMDFADGRQAGLTIEDGAIEVNFPPQKFGELELTWRDIFRRAKARGFRGSIGFGGGGGGGQIHFGFAKPEENLFLLKPALLGRILELPMRFTSILYFMSEFFDHGRDAMMLTPLTNKNRELETAMILRYFSFFDYLAKIDRAAGAPILADKVIGVLLKRMKDIATHAPGRLKDHDSYVSLKNFDSVGTRNKIPNPDAEVRAIRSFNSFEDLLAASEFWLKAMLYFYNNEFGIPRLETLKDGAWHRANDTFPTVHYWRFRNLLEMLDISEESRARLFKFGGTDLRKPLPFKKFSTEDWIKWIQIRTMAPLESLPSGLEVSVPLKGLGFTKPIVTVNGEIQNFIVEHDELLFPLSAFEHKATGFIISIGDNTQKKVPPKRIWIRVYPARDFEPRGEIHSSFDTIRNPTPEAILREFFHNNFHPIYIANTPGISRQMVRFGVPKATLRKVNSALKNHGRNWTLRLIANPFDFPDASGTATSKILSAKYLKIEGAKIEINHRLDKGPFVVLTATPRKMTSGSRFIQESVLEAELLNENEEVIYRILLGADKYGIHIVKVLKGI